MCMCKAIPVLEDSLAVSIWRARFIVLCCDKAMCFFLFLVTFFSPNLRGRAEKKNKMPKEKKNTGSVSQTT